MGFTYLDYRKPDNSQVFFETLTYDGRGNITRRVDDEGTYDHQCDALDQLTRADYPGGAHETFAYDASANRSALGTAGGTATYAVDDADQVVSITRPGASEVTTFRWTNNDEMASEHKSDQTKPTGFTWDTRSMLVLVSIPESRLISFTYLPESWLGCRLTSTASGTQTTLQLRDSHTSNGTLG